AGAGTVTVVGAAAVYDLDNTTRAHIGYDAAPGYGAEVIAQGNVLIAAKDDTEIDVIAGTLSGSGTAAIGGSAGVTVIGKTTEAFIGQNAMVTANAQSNTIQTSTGKFNILPPALDPPQATSFPSADGEGNIIDQARAFDGEVRAPGDEQVDLTADKEGPGETDVVTDDSLSGQRRVQAEPVDIKGVAVTALNKDDLETYTVAGGASGTVAVSLGGGVNVITNNTLAYVDEGAQVNSDTNQASPDQTVLVAAGNDYYDMSVTAVLGIAGTAGVTAGAEVTYVNNTTKAYVEDDTLVQAKKDILVLAESSEDILTVTAGIAGGFAGIGGAATVTVLDNVTYAYIGHDAAGPADA
ncbi:MAG: hypothetical protein GY778_22090, partial [bacterium]|nr:hypothetical protein [bacterium]